MKDLEKVKNISKKLNSILDYLTTKYFEVEDFVLCIILSLISKTHMIALGKPGIAKSAILREIVEIIDFSYVNGTPYFQIQMGADVSPNNVFGAPNIEYYKKHGIIKRAYEGFLPDAIIAYCSEFYRLNDQVANSGLLTILNEGEFKNGTEIIKTNLRFLMADTNFFPKDPDDLDADEVDLKLQALHDRFLARVLVKPLKDRENKIKMIRMDDSMKCDTSIHLKEIILLQDFVQRVNLSEEIATHMVDISEKLQQKYNIFISPRRLKNSRNLIKANALLNRRMDCIIEDIIALRFTFWQKEEDIPIVNDLIFDTLNIPHRDSKEFEEIYYSILDEFNDNLNRPPKSPDEYQAIYSQGIKDLNKLMEKILKKYNPVENYPVIKGVFDKINNSVDKLVKEYSEL